jgi:quercetin dioxygenase-like cupin family protein
MSAPLYHLDEVREFVPFPGYHGKLVHTPFMTIAHWNIRADSPLPVHSHPHEQILSVEEGEFELTVDGKAFRMKAGDVYVIPGDAPHSGRSITDCRIIDVWHPPRLDYNP